MRAHFAFGVGPPAFTPLDDRLRCREVAHALHAFAWMVPGELALFSLDELERAKEWAAG